MLAAVGLLACPPGPARAQQDVPVVRQALDFFAGAWQGRETGAAGLGTGDRVYAFIMRFDPQEQNPEGEVHEDYSIFSYDKLREKIVLREFHSEGYVNQYVLTASEDEGRRLVFESESIQNLPAGWRARLTLTILDDSNFIEVFELAEPGQDHEELLRNHWTRR
jgi:hypothetical protein